MRSPQVYVLNEDGFNDMQDFEVAADRQSAATLGALACPERAIAVED
jgi:ferredoxin